MNNIEKGKKLINPSNKLPTVYELSECVSSLITELEAARAVVDEIKTHFETSSSQSISYHRKFVNEALKHYNKARGE